MENEEILQKLSDDKVQIRDDILKRLREIQPTKELQNYFETLKRGSSTWDEDKFIQGLYLFSDIVGYRRREYFSELWSGCNYPSAFEELWRENHPEFPVTVWDQDFGQQCPPTWSHKIINSRHVLTYHGKGPWSQAMNELLIGPTGMDCGMWCELAIRMASRYTFGDGNCNRVFGNGKFFTITQIWNQEVNEDSSKGSHLYQFYDANHQSRIRTRIFNNHWTYQLKHPGGTEGLQNAIQIDDQYLLFDPKANRKSLSLVEVEHRLLAKYNAPRDFADEKTLSRWSLIPDYEHSDFKPVTFGQMRNYASRMSGHVLSIEDLRSHRAEQEDFCAHFNFHQLKSYVEAALGKQA